MSAALIISGLFVAFQALAGFLFGQLFAGHFSIAASLTGCAGLACSVAAFKMSAQPEWTRRWVKWAALFAIVGVILDAATYYMYMNIHGNYYPWFLVGPYVIGIVFIAGLAWKRDKPPTINI